MFCRSALIISNFNLVSFFLEKYVSVLCYGLESCVLVAISLKTGVSIWAGIQSNSCFYNGGSVLRCSQNLRHSPRFIGVCKESVAARSELDCNVGLVSWGSIELLIFFEVWQYVHGFLTFEAALALASPRYVLGSGGNTMYIFVIKASRLSLPSLEGSFWCSDMVFSREDSFYSVSLILRLDLAHPLSSWRSASD